MTDEEYDAEVTLLIEALGMALYVTIHEATKANTKDRRTTVRAHWSAVARQIIKVAKESE